MSKPILCLDFDGVIHSYTSGWRGAAIIVDKPVPGAVGFLHAATNEFEIHIFSSRSNQEGGIKAMQMWLEIVIIETFGMLPPWFNLIKWPTELIKWPTEKPPAHVTIDDRAITFTGVWPSINDLKNFKPWNKS